MKRINLVLSMLLLSGPFVSSVVSVWGAEGVISKAAAAPANYCHLKFPAIREDTLYSNRPVLKDKSNGDMIDFSGPCDYDPLGKEEIARQKLLQRQRRLPEDR